MRKPIDPELAKHSSEIVDELLKADHIPDATKNVETPSENIWQAFERVLEEHGSIEPSETPEDAAERYAGIMSFDVRGHERGFLEGVRWAEERSKK